MAGGTYKYKPPWKMPLLLQWSGVRFDFSIGDMDFFLLDCRFYRTNPYADTKTMFNRFRSSGCWPG